MCCSEAEHAKEGGRGLLVAGGEGVPFFQAGPGSRQGSDWCRFIPGRTPARLCAGEGGLAARPVPDALAQTVGSSSAVVDNPDGHFWQVIEQASCHRQFACLSQRERERNGQSTAIGDHTGLGAPTATRAAKRFTTISLPTVVSPFRAGRLVRPDSSAVDKHHAKRDPALMHQLEPTFQDALPGPVDEQLCSQPPRAKLRGDAAPLGLVLVPSKDCRNGPPQPFRRLVRGRTSSIGGSHTAQLASVKTSHLLRSAMPQI